MFFSRQELPVLKSYAVRTLGPELALDTLNLTVPSALVSVFCQSAELEARERFSYRKKTLQKRCGYKSPQAIML